MAQARQKFINSIGTFVAPAGVSFVEVLARKRKAPIIDVNESQSAGFIDANGNAFMFGYNLNGQLGTGDVTFRSAPALVVGGHKWQKISTDGGTTIGITTDGQVYCWGANVHGNVGDGTVTDKSTPTLVVGPDNLRFQDIAMGALAGGGYYALSVDGYAYAWGLNSFGQLGLGDVVPRSSPTLISNSLQFKKIVTSSDAATSSGQFTILLSPFGQAYAMGANNHGQLGVGSVTNKSTPTLVLGSLFISDVAAEHTFAACLATTGNAYRWGLGAPLSGTAASTPTLVVGGHSFAAIAVGIDTLSLLQSDGTLYMMGDNTYGQLGDGTVTARTSPAAVLGGFKFSRIITTKANDASPGANSMAITTDGGQLYSWGRNVSGSLGLGDVVPRSTPTLVVGGWSFRDARTNGATAWGVTEDGTLLSWGASTTGEAGQGGVGATSAPTLIAGNNLANPAEDQTLLRFDVTPGASYSVELGLYYGRFGHYAIGNNQPDSIEVFFEQ